MREASLIKGEIPDGLAEALEQNQTEAGTLWQDYKATFPVDAAGHEQQRILWEAAEWMREQQATEAKQKASKKTSKAKQKTGKKPPPETALGLTPQMTLQGIP